MHPTRTKRHRLAATIAVAVIAVLTACTEPDPGPTATAPDPTPTTTTPPPPTESPTDTEDPAETEARAAILDAYQTYWNVSVAALADPNAPMPEDFDLFIVDKARAGLGESVLWAQQNKVVMVGAPVVDPEIAELTLTPDPAAHIVDCVDSTDWVMTLASTGDPASSAPPENTRVTADAWAVIFDGRWVIREVTLNRDEPC